MTFLPTVWTYIMDNGDGNTFSASVLTLTGNMPSWEAPFYAHQYFQGDIEEVEGYLAGTQRAVEIRDTPLPETGYRLQDFIIDLEELADTGQLSRPELAAVVREKLEETKLDYSPARRA
ncbi:hypothetical protein [Chitinophaga nivalis]|uniref:Uncharacterized protein n=1 Tax=Chitinophaga nivalis TaxID=2991709 RepID=A0ABT3IJ00_9BACT|nr:hypothetical protein [Chitinophaga nivalis]MCW3466519.1 hypothetical protein [Chitinophaga nivalis]MCW3483790.1 hypothetical protein [Chitinophaga nivalis]